MNDSVNKAMTISKNNAGFPDYLDFNTLRTEGINHLGKLSGKIWSDFNLHDPGITILELLCYAMLDLGYRTNLPVADILATDPALLKPENNFFTPAQILTNNPLTIADYRKLITDIPGIRNAWLEPARDIKDICRQRNLPAGNNANNAIGGGVYIPPPGQTTGCEEFLNGIYHVIIETELDPDKDFQDEDPNVEEAAKQAFIKEITGAVRKVLMAHRNLCEDFADIYILCKLDTGVCATIEIKNGVKAEDIYLLVANTLRDFFSPTPHFYTLDQMLNKGHTMDEAFAGRPLSPKSHGFIDTEELEAIKLRKEIHVSDIYHVLLDIPGVKKVSRLKFRNCGKPCITINGKKNTDWIFHIPQNHVPVFSLSCSGFEFTLNGLPIVFDQSVYDTQLELAWNQPGKILYKMPSPYLDAAIPKGIYHPDLGDHYSIMEDLPAVYGTGEGDLPDDIPDLRKAQMLQLRGYLMFFDQLLANYLSQLQNIRQLFAFPHPTDPLAQHTYFQNTISTIPEMDQLLRFGEGNGLGPPGTVLSFPVDKSTWDTTVFTTQTAATLLAGFTPYSFSSLFGVYEATDLLRNDLVNDGESQVITKQTLDLNWIYAIVSSTDEFVILGNKIFATKDEAEKHGSSVQYAGVFENNYSSVLISATQFSFNIELNLITYTDYLGILVEDENLYQQRRTGFLTHLLSRFAEQFSDFVIYNWKSVLGVSDIEAAEYYLSAYPDLSRNRGRAFNYQLDGLIYNSISGFEKKVKAIAGIYSGKKNILCPFVVEPFDETYFYDKKLLGGSADGQSGFVYRLVDKEHIPAMFSLSFNDKPTALAKRVPLSKLTRKVINRMPQVDFAADHFIEVSPGLYSFIIPVDHLEGVAGELMLFSSTKKYASKEEAIKGFDENLVDVLSYAADPGKYGDYIISGLQPETVNTIVEIPADAQTALETALGAGWVAELAQRMTIYPFRKIDITSIEYAEIYCKDYEKPDPGTEDDPANLKYYFNLPLDTDIIGNWISTTHFENLEEAMKEFAFFDMLVNYPGNFYADCACTGHFDQVQVVHHFSFKIFMREVLAQSIEIFPTVEDAWGPKGIERFICAAQAGKAFWNYQRNKACDSFYVTCGSGSWKHPCTYDNEEIRKEAMNQLWEAGQAYAEKSSWFFNVSNGEFMDGEGKLFARIAIDKVPGPDRCDLLVTIAGLIGSTNSQPAYHPDSSLLQWNLTPTIIIQSTEKKPGLSDDEAAEWIKAWQKLLQTWAFYFPIIKTKLKTNKGEPDLYKYCVEIKLPGFDERSVRGGKNLCQIAWASDCCYTSCSEALAAWQDAWKILAEKNNYQPVYDCSDESFGLALHRSSDMIAINPQCYPDWKEDCRAVERALRWINIQGLHLIEHILLRPFKPEDCRCRQKQVACGTDCVFPSWVEEDRQCTGKEIQVCFKPGTDPYSFIATVFLPAWSKRFRNEKERLLFERLLYREAPAHVLLRIIWLRPIDFCRLESVMFDWQKWIAGLPACNIGFSLCTLIDLLFNRYYDCLPECSDCLPCKDPQPVKPGCWDDKDTVLRALGFIDQINELYCFEDYCGRQEKPRDRPQEPPEDPKEKPKDPPEEKPQDPPKEDPKDPPKEDPRDKPKEDPNDPPKEDPRDKPKEDPKGKPKEDPKEPGKEDPKEDPNEKPKRRKKPESPIDHVTNLAREKAVKKKKKKKKDK